LLFDTHTHYDEERFDPDRNEVIENSLKDDISYIVNVSYCMKASFISVRLSDEYSPIYAAIGIHPYFAGENNVENISRLKELAKNKKVVAIGEIGLDYCNVFFPKQVQKDCFIRQINLALELHLPIMVHNRDAHHDVFDTLLNTGAREVGGVIHSYSGSVDMVKRFLGLGFYISFAGPVTYHNARKIIDVARYVPMDRMLIETDCPDIPPEPFRGTRNDSGRLKLIADRIAEIKGVSFEEVALETTANAKRLLRI
jgi:TatD DNase family protein